MKLFNTILAVISVAIVAVNTIQGAEVKQYYGSQVLRVTAKSFTDLIVLRSIADSYDFWLEPLNQVPTHADIMVAQEQKERLVSLLLESSLEYSTLIQDVGVLVENERTRMSMKQSPNMSWTEYHRIATVDNWINSMVSQFPNLCSYESIGQSYEGRDMKVFKVSSGGSGKPAIWIDSAIHAREWISPAVNTYVINELLLNVNNADLINGLDFYFLPFVNPDGYDFTFTNERLWRKTRSNHTGSCLGVDCNRNFGFMWGIDDEGSSTNPCTETYRGPSAYSEPEAANARNYIERRVNDTNWTVFITLHSYGQLWLSPYGFSETIFPDDFEELKSMSDSCVAALTAVHGTPYRTGSSSQILYKSNGSSRDWAKGSEIFKWSYTIELRNLNSFILPPEQIIPTAEETWAGLQVLFRHVMRNK